MAYPNTIIVEEMIFLGLKYNTSQHYNCDSS